MPASSTALHSASSRCLISCRAEHRRWHPCRMCRLTEHLLELSPPLGRAHLHSQVVAGATVVVLIQHLGDIAVVKLVAGQAGWLSLWRQYGHHHRCQHPDPTTSPGDIPRTPGAWPCSSPPAPAALLERTGTWQPGQEGGRRAETTLSPCLEMGVLAWGVQPPPHPVLHDPAVLSPLCLLPACCLCKVKAQLDERP